MMSIGRSFVALVVGVWLGSVALERVSAQFIFQPSASKNCAELATNHSDETGTCGGVMLSNSPTFVDDFDLAAAGVRMLGADGILTITGLGDGNDENLTIDFDNAAANVIALASSTGASRITWTGALTVSTGITVGDNTFIQNASGDVFIQLLNNDLRLFATGGAPDFAIQPNVVQAASNNSIGWSSTTAASDAGDLFLERDTADTLAQRRTTNTQIFRIYETFTDASNYERGTITMGSDLMTIAWETAGTGTDNGSVALTAAGTGSVNATGRFAFSTRQSATVDAATTFAATSSYVLLACTGAETINTITGGVVGMELVIENSDTECTIADDDTAVAANAIDLTGTATNDVGAVNKIITLRFVSEGYWLQTAESDN